MATSSLSNKPDWLKKLRLREGWLTFCLLLVVFMTVIWSLQNARWSFGSEILTAAGLLGFLVGFALAKTRFVPALLAHSFMISVGMVMIGILIFPYTDPRYEEWYYKMGSTVQRVVRWLSAAFSGRPTTDELVGLVGLSLLSWVLGYFSAWFVFRRHKVWYAISILGIVLVINLAYNPPNAIGSFTIFLLTSLLAVIRFNVFENEERWRQKRLSFFKNGILGWSLCVGISISFLLVAIAFAAPSNSGFQPLQSFLDQVRGPISSVQSSFGSLFGGDSREKRIGRLNASYNSFNKSFTVGGPISLSNEPVLRVKGYDPTYLQAAVMDQYDGQGWIATYQDSPASGEIVFPQLSLGADQRLPTTPYAGRYENTLEITPLLPGLSSLFTGGDTVSTSRNSLLAFHWEKTIIRANMSQIQAREVGKDLSGQPRILLVDTTTNKPIPPDLLPLVRQLREANGLPAFIEINNVSNRVVVRAGLSQNSTSSVNAARSTTDGTLQATIGNWLFRLDGIDQAGNYNIRISFNNDPGVTYTYLLSRNKSDPNQYSYGSGNGTETRQDFERTSIGKQLKEEIERVKGAPFPTKVDFSMVGGRPNFFSYEGFQPNYDDLLAVSAVTAPAVGEVYRTTALRYRGDIQTLRELGTSVSSTIRGNTRSSNLNLQYPDWVKERYLQLPDNVSQRVRNLALDLTKDKTNLYDKAKAIETYLRGLKYNLNTGFIPNGRELTDYLLFDSKEGYCVHFATAYNVMMRSIGVPTRLVTGFVGGEKDSTGSYTIRGTAAHAWPQVYFPGAGWINFEPTPAYGSIERPADPGAVPPLPTPTPEQTQAATNPQPTSAPLTPDTTDQPVEGESSPVSAGTTGQNEGFNPPFWLWLAVAFIVGVAGSIFAFNTWKKRQYTLIDTSPKAVYARLLESARKAGLPNRNTMTPYEYSTFLSKTLPSAAEPVDRFTIRYVRNRYGKPENDSQQEESEVVRQSWQLYMNSLLEYRKQRLLKKVTPRFLMKRKKEKAGR
jgi:transglutaminase-like putative cysteine protease